MNKEIYHEGWLVKSPPTKRIWRARWRKRWFNLKQGEIPGQFCLEYYTDRNCRKLKGVIDLDQCEQVDSGLRLEHRKQKFQFMFDIKTPRRTYYLAADTEKDMRDWVNCICQVCNLHDFTKQPGERQYYNICENNTPATTTLNQSNSGMIEQQQHYHHGNTSLNSTLNTSSLALGAENAAVRQTTNVSEITKHTKQLSLITNNTYQNNEFPYVNTDYSNRETIICDDDRNLLHDEEKNNLKQSEVAASVAKKQQHQQQQNEKSKVQCAGGNNEIIFIDRSQSFRDISRNTDSSPAAAIIPNHVRTQSLNETVGCGGGGTNNTRTLITSTGVVKKIPENLVLSATAFVESSVEPSPALSTCSGPYIPISECFSGSPIFQNNDVPSTPLNSLDPKFYDTPRSHNNIGLNLTNDQSYSPKIYNCPQTQEALSDSESVFTDDEEWSHSMPLRENIDRNLRPSDSSIENDSIVFTYTQRFSKIPDNGQPSDTAEKDMTSDTKKIPKRRNRLVLESTSDEEKLPDIPQLSDTENTSPAIGPRDASSCVEESYDIPRSHHLPYYNMSTFQENMSTPSLDNPMATSTPDLIAETAEKYERNSAVRTLPRPHFYTNAAPTKIEGNVFRYDFIEQHHQADLPPVNRSLKPKLNATPTATTTVEVSTKQAAQLPSFSSSTIDKSSPPRPPSVDRKLKPTALRSHDSPISASTLRRPGIVSSDSEFNVNHKDIETRTLPRNMSSSSNNNSNFSKMMNTSANLNLTTFDTSLWSSSSSSPPASSSSSLFAKSNNSQLQYFDLDTSNPPPPPPQINRTTTSSCSQQQSGGNLSKLGVSLDSASGGGGGVQRQPMQSGVVYNSVDFLKTEAFKRIREDAEKNRMKD